jgi:hypothetical protein
VGIPWPTKPTHTAAWVVFEQVGSELGVGTRQVILVPLVFLTGTTPCHEPSLPSQLPTPQIPPAMIP